MAELKRLPNGYLKIVKEHKKYLIDLIGHMENLKDVGGHPHNLDTKISTFSMHVTITNKYIDKDGVIHIAFDKGAVAAEALIDRAGKWKLFKTCTIFIDGTDDYVDNYKW